MLYVDHANDLRRIISAACSAHCQTQTNSFVYTVQTSIWTTGSTGRKGTGSSSQTAPPLLVSNHHGHLVRKTTIESAAIPELYNTDTSPCCRIAYPIRIRHGYAVDTPRIRILDVSTSWAVLVRETSDLIRIW